MQASVSLAGQRILITRSRDDWDESAALVRERGGEPIACPLIEISGVTNPGLQNAIKNMKDYDWVILVSSHAVTFFAQCLRENNVSPADCPRIAVMGERTRTQALEANLAVDFLPKHSTADAFFDEFSRVNSVRKLKILYPRSEIAKPTLVDGLGAEGASVDDPVLYKTTHVNMLPQEIREAIGNRHVDWVTLCSSSAAEAWVSCCASAGVDPSSIRIASIGPSTTKTLNFHSISPVAEANPHSMPGLLDAIAQAS